MSTPLARETLLLGAAVAIERGTTAAQLFLAETLESENARRLVLRQLRKRHPELSYEALSNLVEEQLGHGPDSSADQDPIPLESHPPRYIHPVRVFRRAGERRSA